MGISPLHARFLILEHARKRFPQTVHLMGRQTVLLTFDAAVAMIRELGLDPVRTTVEIDQHTRGAQTAQSGFISDRTFFGLLGVQEVVAIDCSDYEGADLILDLNKPIPESMDGTLEFIFGGSVLDNIFDPATYLKNIARLLKPGGRLFEHDIISQHHHPYCLITPAWFHDYFVMNRFVGCTLLVTEHAIDFVHVYGLCPSPDDFISDLGPPRRGIPMGVLLMAEKGVNSTSHVSPIQDQYRGNEDRAAYGSSLLSMEGIPSTFRFEEPTSSELQRLDVRVSRSYRHLGVVRSSSSEVGSKQAKPGDTCSGLRILEATYGGNCVAQPPDCSAVSSIYRGNVTDILASMANGADYWQWVVDVNVLGDPAPRRGKDLEVYYVHSSDPGSRLRRAYVPSEASGQLLQLLYAPE